MTLDARKTGLLGGLNLNLEPSATVDMTVADGVRFEIGAEVTSRLGDVDMDLVWPDENVTGSIDHDQTLNSFSAGKRTRGWNAFYDQRLSTEPPEILNLRTK